MRIQKIIGITIICLALSGMVLAQAGAADGSFETVLVFPKASPTVILTFCPGGEPFQGAWLEEGGKKIVGEMTNKEIKEDGMHFRVQAGPGIWDFICNIEGDTLKGTVTGDGATSSFEGKPVQLEEEYCSK